VEEERQNPLDEWVALPAAVLLSRQEVLPSESIGWGLNLVLSMPARMAFEYVKAQLVTAGFEPESDAAGPSLFRFLREDAMVWGTVHATGEGCQVFLSTTLQAEETPDGD